MKSFLPVVMLLICGRLFAQEGQPPIDSLKNGQKEKSASWLAQQDTTGLGEAKLNRADSVTSRVNEKIDSIQQQVNGFLNPNLNLNSTVKERFNKQKEERDSVQFYKHLAKEKEKLKKKIAGLNKEGQPTEVYEKQLDSLDAVRYQKGMPNSPDKKQQLNAKKQNIAHKKDSLLSVGSTNPYQSKLDSITHSPGALANKVESKAGEKVGKATAPVTKANGVINEKLSLMNQQGGAGANIPTSTNLPNASLPQSVLPETNLHLNQPDLKLDNPLGTVDNPLKDQMGEVGELKSQVSEVKGIPQEQIGKLKSMDGVSDVTDKLGDLNSLTDKAQGYTGDVKNVVDGAGDLKNAPAALEGKVSGIEGVQGMQKEMGQFNEYAKLNNEEAMQQELKKQAMQQMTPAINHFEGKEDVLRAAMDKMSKLKLKHTNLPSMKDITKRVVNEMNGKPFIERIVPGITLQIQKSQGMLIDYNPLLGYRISGKLTAGAGWNERVSVGKHVHFSLKDRIYGPRAFVDLKIGKGFSVRTDIEKMNTYVPGVSTTDPHQRAWVWSAFVGIKKDYKFAGKVRGNTQFLYNLYDDHYNSPYNDRFAIRMGFEFPMKKKTKPDPKPIN